MTAKESIVRIFRVDKPVIAMLHLAGHGRRAVHELAKREIEQLYANGVDAVLVEDYFGSADDADWALGYLHHNYPEHVYGVNLLCDAEWAFVLAKEHGASFMQMDSVCGHLRPGGPSSGAAGKPIDRATRDGDFAKRLQKMRADYPTFLLGGVRFKYQPVLSGRSEERDLHIAMGRCDAVVVTGTGTGVATDVDKIARFRKTLGGFPLIVGAGMTAESCREQLAIADGAIVGTWIKEEGDTCRPVDPQRVRTLMRAVREVRDAGRATPA